MKFVFLILITFLSVAAVFGQDRYWIATTTASWNNTANWSATSGGTAGASVPGAANMVYFNSARQGACVLDVSPTVGGISVSGYNSTINLVQYDLTSQGTTTFSSGTITSTTGRIVLNTAATTTFSNTTIDAPVTGTTGRISMAAGSFSKSVSIIKTAANTDASTGGNTFSTDVTFTNNSNAAWRMSNTNPDVYNGVVNLVVGGTGSIDLAYGATGTQFLRAIAATYNSTAAITVGAAGGTSTMAANNFVSVSYTGSGCGNLTLARFTHQGGNQSIDLTGNTTAIMSIGPASSFTGTLTIVSPSLQLNTSTFNGLSLTKTGTNTDNLRGGNTFNGNFYVNNQGSDLMFGANPADAGDTWNGPAVFENSGGNRIRIPEDTPGNVFNSSVIFNNISATDVASRIQIARLAGSSVTFNGPVTMNNNGFQSDFQLSFDAGSTTRFNGPVTYVNNTPTSDNYLGNNGDVIFAGDLNVTNTTNDIIYVSAGTGSVTFGNGNLTVGTFNAGSLRLRNFTQTGATAQNIVLTGSASLYSGPSSTFNGNIQFTAPRLYLQGATYNGTVRFEKTGSVSDNSFGGNTFNRLTSVVNSGTGHFAFAYSDLDTFNGPLDLTTSGDALSDVHMSYRTNGTVFNESITVNNSSGAQVSFGYNGGTSRLVSGKTINVGSFTSGQLILARLTQEGNTTQNISLAGSAILQTGPASTFNAVANFSAPGLLIAGGTFMQTANLEKNGSGNNSSTGNTTFNGVTTIRNTGAGVLRTDGNNTFNDITNLICSSSSDVLLELASGQTSTYARQVNITNNGTSNVRAGYRGTTTFNGNIVVTSTSGNGILFGEHSEAAITMANGTTITIGGAGFTTGALNISRLTQTGGTAQSLTLTSAGIFRSGAGVTWNGNISVTAPAFQLDGSTYNGTATFIKNGSTTDGGTGNNTFASTSSFTNSGSGIFRLATSNGDTFNGDAAFIQSAGTLSPAYVGASTFAGNISTQASSAITFAASTGSVVIGGGGAQSINKNSGGASPIIRRLVVNKTGGALTLNTDVPISVSSTFTNGIVNATATNFLHFLSGSGTSGASNSSHVNGPVRKTGNAAFEFPVGDGTSFRPISIGAPGNTADYFTATYFKTSPANTTSIPSTYWTISGCEYWTLDRSPTSTASVNVTLSWLTNTCAAPYITDPSTLRVARYNGTQWVDHGNGGTTGNASAGTVVSSSTVGSFSPFTLGSTSGANPLPVTWSYFTGKSIGNIVELLWGTATEINSDHFEIERSSDGLRFSTLSEVKAGGNSSRARSYKFIDEQPLAGRSYYRLKQVDYDQNFSYSSVVFIHREGGTQFSGYPNPAHNEWIHFNKLADIEVFNSMNQLVLHSHAVDGIDASQLKPGVYLIRTNMNEMLRIVVY